jgi:hypothetical protein
VGTIGGGFVMGLCLCFSPFPLLLALGEGVLGGFVEVGDGGEHGVEG